MAINLIDDELQHPDDGATLSPSLAEPHDSRTIVTDLRSQHPLGMIGVPRGGLRLTWSVESSRATEQIAARIAWRDGCEPWHTHLVSGGASIAVVAPGDALPAGGTREFRVAVETRDGWSAWSVPLAVEAALDRLEAVPITADSEVEGPCPLLRRSFSLSSTTSRARLRISSLGLYEAWINGVPVSDEHLGPGWTSYENRLLVATYDVTTLLVAGENILAVRLADGWYRGRLGWNGKREHYGDELAVLAQLDIEDQSGSWRQICSDENWRTGFGAIRMASLYDGVNIDQRQEPTGWRLAGFDDQAWPRARPLPTSAHRFEPRAAPPVRVVAELQGKLVAQNGLVDVDLEQNMVGWLRVSVEGQRGETVTVRHAEVREPDGSLHTAALRGARAMDTYVLDRDGVQTLEPSFTFHGFRYAQITGARVVSATGVVISSDVERRSHLVTANADLNQLHENVVWSQRGNFVSVPTDCPQRDERLGWTGDAQVFAPTSGTLFDVEAFWRSWLIDLEFDQRSDGAVPAVVPNVIGNFDVDPSGRSEIIGRAGWADAAVLVPWAVYVASGSNEVLLRQMSSMRRWVAYLQSKRSEDGLLPSEFQFGDWLDPDAPPDRPEAAKISSDFVANAYFSWSARVLARVERLVGDSHYAERWETLADDMAALTWAKWAEHARSSATGCAISIEFGIAPSGLQASLGEDLAEIVRTENGRVSTGFLGTPLVLPALTRTGHVDEAYLMLLRTESPSWLAQVRTGATTVWERWDALRADGSIHPGDMESGTSMLSFNHYAYGAVIDWVYRTVAGIAPVLDRPGYQSVLVAPRPCAELPFAQASVNSALGPVTIAWRLLENEMEIDLSLPFGASADLDLPVTSSSLVTVNGESADGPLLAGTHKIVVTNPAVATISQRSR